MHNGIELGTIGGFHANRSSVDDLQNGEKQSNSSVQTNNLGGDKKKDEEDLSPSDGKSAINSAETEMLQFTVHFKC